MELSTAAKKILEFCYENCDEYIQRDSPRTVDEDPDKWTVVDLFIRQWVNNLCDGFGLYNVQEVSLYLIANKNILVDNQLINKDGFNNSDYPLWKDYDFDKYI